MLRPLRDVMNGEQFTNPILPSRGRPRSTSSGGGNKICCYSTCTSDSRTAFKRGQNLTFHPFPKPCKIYRDQEIQRVLGGRIASEHCTSDCEKCSKCQRWLFLCNRRDGRLSKLYDVTSSTYVCNLHFANQQGPTASYPDPLPSFMVINTSKLDERLYTVPIKINFSHDESLSVPVPVPVEMNCRNGFEPAEIFSPNTNSYAGRYLFEENNFGNDLSRTQFDLQTEEEILPDVNPYIIMQQDNVPIKIEIETDLETITAENSTHAEIDPTEMSKRLPIKIETEIVAESEMIAAENSTQTEMEAAEISTQSETLATIAKLYRWAIMEISAESANLYKIAETSKHCDSIAIKLHILHGYKTNLYVLGSPFKSDVMINSLVENVKDSVSLRTLMDTLNELKVCSGITDEKVIRYMSPFVLRTDICFRESLGSIRSKDCKRLCYGRKCHICMKLYYKINRQLKNRSKMMKSPANMSKFCNDKFLTVECLQEKLKVYTKRMKLAEKAVRRFKSCLGFDIRNFFLPKAVEEGNV